ncbi:MAG: DUF192 domain-containing protein [Anaerolineae bacterium]
MTMPSFLFVQNQTRPLTSPAKVKSCETFVCRLRGLMFRSHLAPDEGLLLVESGDSRLNAAIHMLFVGFDLAVIWINSDMVVVDKVLARSWQPAYTPRQAARYILEIHPSRLEEYQIGDRVKFQNA